MADCRIVYELRVSQWKYYIVNNREILFYVRREGMKGRYRNNKTVPDVSVERGEGERGDVTYSTCTCPQGWGRSDLN